MELYAQRDLGVFTTFVFPSNLENNEAENTSFIITYCIKQQLLFKDKIKGLNCNKIILKQNISEHC